MRRTAAPVVHWLSTAACLALAACNSTTTATAPVYDPPAALLYDSGVGQVGSVGTTLPRPIEVLVTDANGKVLYNVPVTWSVRGAGGTLSQARPLTDGNGIAGATWTLGATVGADTVDVSIAGGLSLSFVATVVP